MTLRAIPREDHPPAEEEDILILGKKRYAAGLIWFTADTDLIETNALVKQRARHLGADFYCSRSTIASQQGFGFLAKGHKMGMPSAAAKAADTLIGEWHGVFAADNGWWYVSIHSDAIAPDGDRLFHSEEDAYNHFVQASESYKWPRSYAPEAWNLPGTNGELLLNKLLEGPPPAGSLLRPITLDAFFGGPQRKKVVLASLAIFILLALTMISLLLAASSGSKRVREAGTAFILSAPIGNIIEPPPALPLRRQDFGDIALQIPPPDQVLTTCMETLDKLMVPLPGWDMQTSSCDGAQASIEWRKISGSLTILQAALKKFPPDTLVVYTGTDKFIAKLSVPVTKPAPSRIMNFDTAILTLNKKFSDLGTLQIKSVAPKAPPSKTPQKSSPSKRKGLVKPVPEAPQPRPYLDMTLISSAPPPSLSSAFDVSGLKLQNVTWDLKARSWTYKAQILFNNEVASNVRTTP